jgi:hypothetical protein
LTSIIIVFVPVSLLLDRNDLADAAPVFFELGPESRKNDVAGLRLGGANMDVDAGRLA